jgi:hypothetical protein
MNTVQSAALITAALASVVGYYTVSVHASNERMAIASSRATIARDVGEIHRLRADLRTRSRLPELQRWNEQVLGLTAPRAEQLVTSPVMLAAYAAPRAPTVALQPNVNVAVVRDVVVATPLMHQASYSPRTAHDLGTDAALAGGEILATGFHKVALR